MPLNPQSFIFAENKDALYMLFVLLIQIRASDATHHFIATALFHMAKNDHTYLETLANCH